MAKTIIKDIKDFSQESMLIYMQSIMKERAIPDVRDGNKPVQRAILYSCWRKGYFPNKSHVKCATIVGDVIGSLHPHGRFVA